VKEYLCIADIASKRDRYAEMVMRRNVFIQDGNPLTRSPDRILSELQIVWMKQDENLRYEDMEASYLSLINRPALKNNCEQIVDGTGVGDAVIESLRKLGAFPHSIVFTNGGRAHPVYADIGQVFGESRTGELAPMRTVKEWLVPRRDLVSSGALVLEQQRLAIARSVAHREAFEAQLTGFTLNRKKQKYMAETEDLHDDLVVCFLMGAWWTHYFEAEIHEGDLPIPQEESASWDPLARFELPDSPQRETPQTVQPWR
jgi:hypothetical protein